MRVAASEYPPLMSESLPHHGVGLRVLTEALALVGVTAEFDFMPWPRMMELGSAGRYDIHSFWIYSDERAERNLFSDVLLVEDVVFFHRRDDEFDWATIEDLRGKRIGMVRGWRYSDELDRAVRDGVVIGDFVNDETQSFRKLAHGRVDAVLTARASGLASLEQALDPERRAAIVAHARPLVSWEERLLVSKNLPYAEALIEKINVGLAALRASGRTEALLAPVPLR